jgi:hypothetical protein
MHYKIDLLTDEQLAHFTTNVNDEISLEIPDGQGGFERQTFVVTDVEIIDAGAHPDLKIHLNKVTLKLE